MRNILLVLATAGAGCLLWAAGAAAEVVTNTSVPVAPFSAFVPCANGGAGEIVDLTGDLHLLSSVTVNGNNVSGKVQVQPQGVKGIGETTGNVYQGVGVTQEQFTISLQNPTATDTFVDNFGIIGAGPGNNFFAHVTFHLTFDATGYLDAVAINAFVACA
jgi:hypothetical protein